MNRAKKCSRLNFCVNVFSRLGAVSFAAKSNNMLISAMSVTNGRTVNPLAELGGLVRITVYIREPYTRSRAQPSQTVKLDTCCMEGRKHIL